MSELLPLYFYIFGFLTIAGGILGFVKAKSRASLIAGSLSGLLLLIAAYIIGAVSARNGLIMALVVSFLLAGRFLPAFLKKRQWMPAGMMSILSVIGVGLAIAGLFR